MSLEDTERQVIKAAMQFFQGKRSSVADSLGISARTLDYKLAKYREDEKAALDKMAASNHAQQNA